MTPIGGFQCVSVVFFLCACNNCNLFNTFTIIEAMQFKTIQTECIGSHRS